MRNYQKVRKKLIAKIVNDENKLCDDNNSITESIVNFYSNLYKREQVIKPPQRHVTNLPKVGEDIAEERGN